jgi:hypothetical protein
MPSFSGAISAEKRANLAWRLIQRNPTAITFYRGSAYLAAQTVRVTFDRYQVEVREAGEATVRRVVIFGVQGHATVTDTDIDVGDRFAIDGQLYEVQDVVRLPGSVQAFGERVSST